MIRAFALAAVTAVVAAVVAVGAMASPSAMPKLIGVVGKNNAYKISLKNPSGHLVKKLKAGNYTFVIHDDSKIHNYELDGPHGKSWTFTSVQFKGTKTKTIKLTAGKYKAYCAPHESTMFQHFTVR
jgi:plastocyanin